MKIAALPNDSVKELVMLYAPDMDDAITMAKIMTKNGYAVQIGPMSACTRGVRVKIWDGREQTEEKSENDRDPGH